MKNNNNKKYRSYDPNRSRDSVSPVCGIFLFPFINIAGFFMVWLEVGMSYGRISVGVFLGALFHYLVLTGVPNQLDVATVWSTMPCGMRCKEIQSEINICLVSLSICLW